MCDVQYVCDTRSNQIFHSPQTKKKLIDKHATIIINFYGRERQQEIISCIRVQWSGALNGRNTNTKTFNVKAKLHALINRAIFTERVCDLWMHALRVMQIDCKYIRRPSKRNLISLSKWKFEMHSISIRLCLWLVRVSHHQSHCIDATTKNRLVPPPSLHWSEV